LHVVIVLFSSSFCVVSMSMNVCCKNNRGE
jgi:hypothetical protein